MLSFIFTICMIWIFFLLVANGLGNIEVFDNDCINGSGFDYAGYWRANVHRLSDIDRDWNRGVVFKIRDK